MQAPTPKPSAAVRPGEPVSLEAATQSATVVGGALKGTEAAAKTLASPPGPELQARLAAAPAADRRALVGAFLQARKAADEAHQRAMAGIAAARAATGPVSRIRALADANVPGLQAAAAALFMTAKALRADPALGHLLPAAFGPGPAASATGPAPAGAAPSGAAPGAVKPPPMALGAATTSREARALGDVVAAVEPLHVYTASRTPHLEAGLALAQRGVKPAEDPYEAMLIAMALGHLFGQRRDAAALAAEAGKATAELRRGLLAARAPVPAISGPQLLGLAVPLTQLPFRCAPFPVLQDLFPKLAAGPAGASGQRLSMVG